MPPEGWPLFPWPQPSLTWNRKVCYLARKSSVNIKIATCFQRNTVYQDFVENISPSLHHNVLLFSTYLIPVHDDEFNRSDIRQQMQTVAFMIYLQTAAAYHLAHPLMRGQIDSLKMLSNYQHIISVPEAIWTYRWFHAIKRIFCFWSPCGSLNLGDEVFHQEQLKF